MPPQLKRLLPIFGVVIVLFLVARHFLIPDSFGKVGHYRFNAIAEIQALPMHYAGSSACADCHDDVAAWLGTDAHQGISCETCHGPGLMHIEEGTAETIQRHSEREFCGLCHAYSATRRPDQITQVNLKEHNPEKKCIECHNSHRPWEIEEN